MVEVSGITVECGLPVSWGVAAAVVDVHTKRSRAIGSSSSRVEKDFVMVDSRQHCLFVMKSFWIFFVGDGGEAGREKRDTRIRVLTRLTTFSSAAFLNDVRFFMLANLNFSFTSTIVL